MNPRRILDRDQAAALGPPEAEFRDRGGGVVEQPLSKLRIAPRPGDNARAVARPDLVLEGIDDRIEGGSIEQAFLFEQRLQRLDPQRGAGWSPAVFIAHRFLPRPVADAAGFFSAGVSAAIK